MWLTALCQLLARAQCVIVSEVHSVCSTINMQRKCINSSDAFCYICGEVTFKSWRLTFTPLIKKCYEHYFGCKVDDQDKSWAPHFCCVTCARLLTAWAKDLRCMPFDIPMVWREPTDHVPDCYFCLTSTTAHWARITRKLAKILALLVLFETHIFNKTKMKIRKISKKFNEMNVTEEEWSYSLSVLLLYSESLGFVTVAEVLAPDVSEGGASKRARTAEGSDPLDFFDSSHNKEITGSDVNISLHIKSRLVDSLDNFPV